MEGVDYLGDERNKAQFDVEAMKVAWAGSPEAFEVCDRMAKLVANDPVFEKFSKPMLGRKELFKNTLRKAAHAWKLFNDLHLTEEEAKWLRHYIDEPNYTDLHWEMFVPALEGQCTEEQKKKWLPLAKTMQIIGTYAQTELGHGSNVQGLETTATFDRQTEEFVIHSPTLTSSKWWPGGLAKVATHAIVYARLIIDGHFHGVNGFIVQIRSLEDHSPLPGITVGDIGMKFGHGTYNTMDNGVAKFDHVRIPRDQMLMRVSQVTKEGKYVKSNVPRQVGYATMVSVRQTIVADASKALSRAVCIATRYSAVRRQFGSRNGGPETQVIDYKTQQNRLFPLLASAFAFRFASNWLKSLYTDLKQRLQVNDFSTLPEAHACTAGLKSLTTAATAEGIEECRKLCGGHGYLISSGLPELFAFYVPACTYEGENVVMLLQVARFLVKTVSDLGNKQPVGTAAYLGRVAPLTQKNCVVQTAEDWLNPGAIVEAFEARAARMAASCCQRLAEYKSPEEGFAELSADLVEASLAHCQVIVVSTFIRRLQQDIPGKGVKQALEVLCYVYALFLLHKHQGDFLATGYLTPKQASLANDQLRTLYSKVRPNAIALVDSFNHTDHYLSSVLGCYDGNVYPKLYEAAMKDPLNDSDIPDGIRQYVQPILKQKLHSAKL
ncbi:putative acyl-CoA oxidase, acyl-CoA dehydrogenase/oxidase and middle domain superfamily [Helianthus annuus]|uniref:Acyl-coenzyme A oxidase n=2 Tax=Helianthus annuus TaxID=4232 RepID=A0A9K3IF33_HELAN|nr:peroxisomal acyl-coenzyme A oxidase 1 [Helianthus annuus]XP_021977767.1 peroxisomal acyl-coenzyme A oxidase 1 [Helianthus annuus]KAF5795806.1 putative acyl-CoA dehydrogenase/oxidase and middle domain superfamily, acyl-CoA oxidase [Helianthus annuus]KAJ0547358.1 putative acyl-CoA oxidase, acyl-CoA dehydrogenase/oxidase and middle domain superfamily [Helianthus annuus]KAJ0553917.1 putative acyl-CoA oxidase, acyl-CoA dehydrogenase/oxidase and middle domain superfamily [Helianthus annuus]KAJ071